MILEIHRKLIGWVESDLKKYGSTKVLSLFGVYSFLFGVLIVIPVAYVIKHQTAIETIMCIIFVICLSYFQIIALHVCLKRLMLDLEQLEKLREEKGWKQ